MPLKLAYSQGFNSSRSIESGLTVGAYPEQESSDTVKRKEGEHIKAIQKEPFSLTLLVVAR
jgi:hypothetical protein